MLVRLRPTAPGALILPGGPSPPDPHDRGWGWLAGDRGWGWLAGGRGWVAGGWGWGGSVRGWGWLGGGRGWGAGGWGWGWSVSGWGWLAGGRGCGGACGWRLGRLLLRLCWVVLLRLMPGCCLRRCRTSSTRCSARRRPSRSRVTYLVSRHPPARVFRMRRSPAGRRIPASPPTRITGAAQATRVTRVTKAAREALVLREDRAAQASRAARVTMAVQVITGTRVTGVVQASRATTAIRGVKDITETREARTAHPPATPRSQVTQVTQAIRRIRGTLVIRDTRSGTAEPRTSARRLRYTVRSLARPHPVSCRGRRRPEAGRRTAGDRATAGGRPRRHRGHLRPRP